MTPRTSGNCARSTGPGWPADQVYSRSSQGAYGVVTTLDGNRPSSEIDGELDLLAATSKGNDFPLTVVVVAKPGFTVSDDAVREMESVQYRWVPFTIGKITKARPAVVVQLQANSPVVLGPEKKVHMPEVAPTRILRLKASKQFMAPPTAWRSVLTDTTTALCSWARNLQLPRDAIGTSSRCSRTRRRRSP